jgi:arylsulfatase A-like enzyme
MVSAVDVVPTVLDGLGMPAFDHRVEGRSLLDLTRARTDVWRGFVVSELDYGYRGARVALGRHPGECRAWMVRDTRWKYVHWQGIPPPIVRSAERSERNSRPRRGPRARIGPGADARQPARLVLHAEAPRDRHQREVAAKTNVYKQAGVFFGVW